MLSWEKHTFSLHSLTVSLSALAASPIPIYDAWVLPHLYWWNNLLAISLFLFSISLFCLSTKSVIVLYLLAAVLTAKDCPASLPKCLFAVSCNESGCSSSRIGVTNLTSIFITARSWLSIWLQWNTLAGTESIAWDSSLVVPGKALDLILAWCLFIIGRCLQELLFPDITAHSAFWYRKVLRLSLVFIGSWAWSFSSSCVGRSTQLLTDRILDVGACLVWVIETWAWVCLHLKWVNWRLHTLSEFWTSVCESGGTIGSWAWGADRSATKPFVLSKGPGGKLGFIFSWGAINWPWYVWKSLIIHEFGLYIDQREFLQARKYLVYLHLMAFPILNA